MTTRTPRVYELIRSTPDEVRAAFSHDGRLWSIVRLEVGQDFESYYASAIQAMAAARVQLDVVKVLGVVRPWSPPQCP